MTDEVSYIDYETFIDPAFSAVTFANQLVLATNDPTDTFLDLSTPLSRVLFDVQEVDTHIDNLTTANAVPLLVHTQDRHAAATKLLETVEGQVSSLTESYKRLEIDVIGRFEDASRTQLAATRLCSTVRWANSVMRYAQQARQLEMLMQTVTRSTMTNQKYTSMSAAAETVLVLKDMVNPTNGQALDRINLVKSIHAELVTPSERTLIANAQQMIKEFSLSSARPPDQTATFSELQDLKSQMTAACSVLYLLSSFVSSQKDTDSQLLRSALQTYLQNAVTTSLSSLARALAALPTLDRALLEVSTRCQSIVALEALLASLRAPQHPLRSSVGTASTDVIDGDIHSADNLLEPLLTSLDSRSLPSYFWRSLASGLSGRVREILTRGGVSARALRSSREKVAQAVRECVSRGSQVDVDALGSGSETSNVSSTSWEREAAVMIGSITGPIGR